jgi:hypothetical protein
LSRSEPRGSPIASCVTFPLPNSRNSTRRSVAIRLGKELRQMSTTDGQPIWPPPDRGGSRQPMPKMVRFTRHSEKAFSVRRCERPDSEITHELPARGSECRKTCGFPVPTRASLIGGLMAFPKKVCVSRNATVTPTGSDAGSLRRFRFRQKLLRIPEFARTVSGPMSPVL